MNAEHVRELIDQFGRAQAEMILKKATVGGTPIAPASSSAPLPVVITNVGDILPAFEDLHLEKEEQRGVLPPLDEMRLVPEHAGAEAERQRRSARAKAAHEYNEHGAIDVEEIPSVLDPAMEAAKRRMEGHRAQAAHERAYARLTGNEEPVYDAIDPGLEERRKKAEKHNEYLKSGGRMAAQAGMGSVGQALGGAADVAMGVATADPIQAVAGGIQLVGAVTHQLAQGIGAAGEAIHHIGDQMSAIAKNDYMGAFNNAVDYSSKALEKIPIAGEVLSAGLQTAVAPVQAFTEVVTAFVERGKELARYSPELAVSNAMADVRSMFADMHEADVLGPDLARLTDAQSEVWNDIRELLLPIKETIVSFSADILETVKTILEFIKLIKQLVGDAVNLLGDLVTFSPLDAINHVKEAVKHIHSFMQKKDQKDPVPTDFWGLLNNVQAPTAVNEGAAIAASRAAGAFGVPGIRPALIDGF